MLNDLDDLIMETAAAMADAWIDCNKTICPDSIIISRRGTAWCARTVSCNHNADVALQWKPENATFG